MLSAEDAQKLTANSTTRLELDELLEEVSASIEDECARGKSNLYMEVFDRNECLYKMLINELIALGYRYDYGAYMISW